LSLPPLEELVRPRPLPQERPPDDLPRWASRLRGELVKWDRKYFDGSAEPWLRKADSHELLALEQEALDLPGGLLEEAIRAAGDIHPR
jgi:hypothetical protein